MVWTSTRWRKCISSYVFLTTSALVVVVVIAGWAGDAVSTVRFKVLDGVDTLPAASVAVTVKE